MKVRTRFAPSPTGYLHVGGIRTAVFGWLLARQNKGQFILRLEDTDQKREVAGAAKHIQDSLKTLGLNYDEGPDIGGPYSPYRQSERLDIYHRWAQKLISAGRAYADPTSEDKLNQLRQEAKTAKKAFLYRQNRPPKTPEWQVGLPLRFKSNPKAYKWHDEVMGDIQTGPEVIDDFILIKADGYPTYNFAHIVDDAEMEISHVIRGQEFLPSMPNYLNLYEALEIDPPLIATVPHILAAEGNKKLSKRDGAKDVLDYVREGFLPEALVNFIASLGWNDGSEQEIFTLEELIQKFSLARVQRSGARFDDRRLLWMNGYFIRELPIERLGALTDSFWPKSAALSNSEHREAILKLVQDRLKFLAELADLTWFFFEEPAADKVANLLSDPPDKQLRKIPKDNYSKLLFAVHNSLKDSDFSPDDLADRLNHLLDELQTKPGVLFALIRIAVTGSASSPELFGTLAALGKTTSLDRLQKALQLLEA